MRGAAPRAGAAATVGAAAPRAPSRSRPGWCVVHDLAAGSAHALNLRPGRGDRGRCCSAAGQAPDGGAAAAAVPGAEPAKVVWVETTTQAVATAAVEAGVTTLLFRAADADLARAWEGLASFDAVVWGVDGSLVDAGSGRQVGIARTLATPADVLAAQELAASPATAPGSYLLADAAASDWAIIPAENLVAAVAAARRARAGPRLLVRAHTAAAALALLGALEAGPDGVVLATQDSTEVRALATALARARVDTASRLVYDRARVTRVASAGMGDRVCVDLTTALRPGEGLLTGSFAGGLFLVAAETAETGYVASRPFRVNAGALHQYVAAPGGRTAYLAELRAGAAVLVADAAGRVRPEVVGRCKVERRPMTLVEAATADGAVFSAVLQNAETVRLVAPPGEPLSEQGAATLSWVLGSSEGADGGSGAADGDAPDGDGPPAPPQLDEKGAKVLRWALKPEGGAATTPPRPPSPRLSRSGSATLSWVMQDADGDGLPDDPDADVSGLADGVGGRPPARPADAYTTVAVSAVVPGQALLVLRAPAARHTGVEVDETIEER